MTAEVDIVNRALQAIGTRTTVTAAELASQSSNEAIQAQLVIEQLRDELLRMAPWNCATNWANLVYITSQQGTPENTSPGTALWQKGIPPPPWAYEYQYPANCLRPLWIVPQNQTGFSGGVPITTAVTGGVANFWTGPGAKYRVAIDQFYPVTAAAVASAGSGYAVGDIWTGAGYPQGSAPIGAPLQMLVTGVSGGGGITAATIISVFLGDSNSSDNEVSGGSYFLPQSNPISQGSTTGVGTGATFTATFGAQGDQRVILTEQEFALCAYIKQVTDPNVMDSQFIQAWVAMLGARLVYQLTGDKAAANLKIAEANAYVMEARKSDGNENLTINDVTPDWIRVRGVNYPNWGASPNVGFDWGGVFAFY